MDIMSLIRRIVKPTPGPRPAPVVIRPVRGGAIEPWEDTIPRKLTPEEYRRTLRRLAGWED